MQTPLQLGYRFPAEWEKHEATWLTWPYLDDSFPGKLDQIYAPYLQFIREISKGELIRINVPDLKEGAKFIGLLAGSGIDTTRVEIFLYPTNDVWCRDHGPAFLVNPNVAGKKIIIDWDFNAWGGKYPFELDNQVPQKIAKHFNLPVFRPGIVMEGGSVEFNGNGTLLTTTACLLNKNRNPHLTRGAIEQYLRNFYGIVQVLWLGEGIAGDDTDGHIDDITRFVNEDTVVTVVETDKNDENYRILLENRRKLSSFRLLSGSQLNIAELPMPTPVYYDGRRLPASYANFYISNHAVIVPTFNCPADRIALDIFSSLFTDRQVVGIHSTDIVWGLGSFHCLSQQEPAI